MKWIGIGRKSRKEERDKHEKKKLKQQKNECKVNQNSKQIVNNTKERQARESWKKVTEKGRWSESKKEEIKEKKQC